MKTTLRLTIAPFLLAIFAVSTATVQAEDYTYMTNDGTITITGCIGGGAVVIPNEINGLPVTTIGNGAFADGPLASVIIPNSVTTVGEHAFDGCGNLTNVTVGSGTTIIGTDAFTACPRLTAIVVDPFNPSYSSADGVLFNKTRAVLIRYPEGKAGTSYSIPSGVTDIGYEAFDRCFSLKEVTVPDSVINIGPSAFTLCTGLTNVTIPNSVANIGGYAFSSCASLTSVTIPHSVTNIGQGAFASCLSLATIMVDALNPSYTTVAGVLFDKGQATLIRCPPAGSAENYAVTNGVTCIGFGAFDSCTNLTGVTIPDSVTTIDDSAFCNCTSLTNIMVPDSVISIGNEAFYLCTSLTAIDVGLLSAFYSSIDGVLFNKGQTTLIQCPGRKAGNYTVPSSVMFIRDGAFLFCSQLTAVIIPDSVINLETPAFFGCRSLTNVIIGNSITSIRYDTFWDCWSLRSVTIGTSVTNIGDYAFLSCTNLTSVAIPDSVTHIGWGAFSTCTSLTNVSIGNRVTHIEGCAFFDCWSLRSVTIGSSVTHIGFLAFHWCTNLTSLTIPSSLTRIEDDAFWACISLKEVMFKGNAPSYGGDIFIGASDAWVCYLPGTIGWTNNYAGRPTAPWLLPYPVILTTAPNFGVQTNAFGFRISWATNASVVVEASTTPANPVWSRVSTNILTSGWSDFRDIERTNYPARFYRLRSP